MTPGPGVVVAMRREMQVLRRAWRGQAVDPASLCLCGIGPRRAREAASALLEGGRPGLVSIGLAGGLDPELRCGDILVPRQVMHVDGRRFDLDGPWRERLMQVLIGQSRVRTGDVVSVPEVAASPQSKAALADRTGACAVDMEAAAVVQACDQHARPALVIKVIVDVREHGLPRSLGRTLDHFGSVRPAALALELLRGPGLLRHLFSLARACREAEAALLGVAACVGPDLQLARCAPVSEPPGPRYPYSDRTDS